MKKTAVYLTLIVLLSAIVRLYFAYGIPASGDETISLIQACGKAHLYGQFCQEHIGSVIPTEDISWFMEYSDDHGLSSVAESMKRAGMHPPLYYFFLHYVIKYLGNDPFTLRCISILFSLGSVVMVYLIGKELKDSQMGLMAAALFGLSTYGVKFALMIRPYPMVMFIALLSTWIALRWAQKDRFRFRDVHYWAISILSIAGFYSIYHFIFMLAFLWSFLFFKSLSRKKDILVILSIPAITGLAFWPWVSSLQTQIQVVNRGNFYFNSVTNPIAGIGQLLTLNFTQCLPFKIIPSLFILAFLLAMGVSGLLMMVKQKNGLLIIGSLTVYVIANTVLDLIMKTNTICISKLAFFLSPVTLLFFVAGCRYLKDRFHWKLSPYPILLGLAAVHTAMAFPYDIAIDGPYGKTLLKKLKTETSSGPTLAVTNQLRRRYVLSYHQAMDPKPDFMFAPATIDTETRSAIDFQKDYQNIVVLNFEDEKATVEGKLLSEIRTWLQSNRYDIKTEHPCDMGQVQVFQKAGNQPPSSAPTDTEN